MTHLTPSSAGMTRRKVENGRCKKTLVSLTDRDRDHLEFIKGAYHQGTGLKPTMSLVVSIGLEVLAARVRTGELPRHPSLRRGVKRN